MHTPIGLPLPQELRERFKDYPSHLEELQEALDSVLAKGMSGTPIFEQAIWALEGQLDSFVSSARVHLKSLQTSGDSESATEAQKEVLFMLQSSSVLSYDLSELQAYLDQNVGVYRDRY